MTLSELIAAAQAALAEHGDLPVMQDGPEGGYNQVEGPFQVKDVYACPEKTECYWGDFDDHSPI